MGEGSNHVVEDGGYGVEPLGGGTDIAKADFVEEDLLHNEGGDRLRQLRSGLHDAEAEGYYLGLEKKINDVSVIHLDKSANDAKGGEAQVLKGARLGLGVEERVEAEGDMSLEEKRPGVWVGRDTLQQREGIADTVGGVGGQCRGREEGVDRHNLLQECGNGPVRVPENRREVGEGFALLRQLEKDPLSLRWHDWDRDKMNKGVKDYS